MLALIENPADAYRRSAFDARVRAAKAGDLVIVCLEQVAEGLGKALAAHRKNDRSRRAEGLTHAHAALTALEMGIDRSGPLAGPLGQLYSAARKQVLNCVTDFRPEPLEKVMVDFAEIAEAMRIKAA